MLVVAALICETLKLPGVYVHHNALPQGAQALICISVVCFSVYLFYECLYIAF
jgi:hypothetical protein